MTWLANGRDVGRGFLPATGCRECMRLARSFTATLINLHNRCIVCDPEEQRLMVDLVERLAESLRELERAGCIPSAGRESGESILNDVRRDIEQGRCGCALDRLKALPTVLAPLGW